MTVAVQQVGLGTNEISCNTLRGLYYKLQSTTDLSVPFTDEPGGATLAFEGFVVDHQRVRGIAEILPHGLFAHAVKTHH